MLKKALLSAALVATWFPMFFITTIFTIFILAPWDTAITLPPVGSWQRTLNDWFSQGLGQYLFSGLAILINAGFALWFFRHQPQRVPQLILSNLLLIIGLPLVAMVAGRLTPVLFPYPPVNYDPDYIGYHLSVLPFLAAALVYGAWLVIQRRLQQPLA